MQVCIKLSSTNGFIMLVIHVTPERPYSTY